MTQRAALPDGPFTRSQALAVGHTGAGVAAALRTGQWTRLQTGAYVETAVLQAAGEAERHAIEVAARLLVLRPGWVGARRSAAVLHDLPLLGTTPQRVQLVAAPLRPSDRARSRHERLAALTEPERSVARGVPVTGLARTVVDVSRSEGRRGGVVLADAALRRGLEPAELAWVVQQCSTWPGATRAVAVACFADGRSESLHESVSRVVLAELGLPAPEPQVEVWLDGVLLGRMDFLWKDRRTVGEADGMAKYVDRGVLRAEKLRQEALEDVGLQVVRWGWEESWSRPSHLRHRVQRAFVRGGTATLAPGVRFASTSVPRLRRAA